MELPGKRDIPQLPNEILLHIFSEYAFTDVGTECDTRADYRNPSHPFYAQCSDGRARRLTVEHSCSQIATKLSLSLVSKLFNSLSKHLLYAFVRISSGRQLHAFNETLARSSGFRGIVERYTRRMDLILMEEPEQAADWTSQDHRRRAKYPARRRRRTSDYEVAGSVLLACPGLTHLTVSVCHELVEDGHPFGDIVAKSCPSLQALSWRFAPKIKSTPLLSDLAVRLRMLEVSCVALLHVPFNIDAEELPHLHTLKGAINLLLPVLRGVRLPSLRTFIVEMDGEVNFQNAGLVPLADEFFMKHGQQIHAFVCYSAKIPIKLDAMPNLRELTLSPSHTSLLASRRRPMTNLSYIGILGAYQHELEHLACEQQYSNLRSWMCYPDDTLLCVLDICDNIIRDRNDSVGSAFPALKTVQILAKVLSLGVTRMKGSTLESHSPIVKFKREGIRFLDCNGDYIKTGEHLEATMRKKRTTMSTDQIKLRPGALSRVGNHVRHSQTNKQTPTRSPGRPRQSISSNTTLRPSEENSLSRQFDFVLRLERSTTFADRPIS